MLAAVLLTACAKQHYVAEPIDVVASYEQVINRDHSAPGFREFLIQNDYPVSEWPIREWDLQALTLAGIYFSPAVNVARSELAMAHAGEQIAHQRPNPNIEIPLEHHDEPNDSPWVIGLIGGFLFQNADKGIAAADEARAKVLAAEIGLQQQAWRIYSELHQQLINYSAAIMQKQQLQVQHDLLKLGIRI